MLRSCMILRITKNRTLTSRNILSWRSTYSSSSRNPSMRSSSEEFYARLNAVTSLAVRTSGILTGKVSDASSAFNEMTGYASVERLKEEVLMREKEVSEARQRLRESKRTYEEAIETRANSQREINSLLQRKHEWSDIDVSRFAELYRADQQNELREKETRKRLSDAESDVERGYANLNRTILARYHEEQIWSDKIRRAGTFGSWGLMCFNVLLFIVVQTIVEPRKRQKLTEAFEQSLVTKHDQDRIQIRQEFFEPFIKHLEEQQEKLSESIEKQEAVLNSHIVDPNTQGTKENVVSMKSAAMGAAAGAAAGALLMSLFFSR